jgi:hypothetical protein
MSTIRKFFVSRAQASARGKIQMASSPVRLIALLRAARLWMLKRDDREVTIFLHPQDIRKVTPAPLHALY